MRIPNPNPLCVAAAVLAAALALLPANGAAGDVAIHLAEQNDVERVPLHDLCDPLRLLAVALLELGQQLAATRAARDEMQTARERLQTERDQLQRERDRLAAAEQQAVVGVAVVRAGDEQRA